MALMEETMKRGVIGYLAGIVLVLAGCLNSSPYTLKASDHPVLLKIIPIEESSIRNLKFILNDDYILTYLSYVVLLIQTQPTKIVHTYRPYPKDSLISTLFSGISSIYIFDQEHRLLTQRRGLIEVWDILSGENVLIHQYPDTNAKATAVSKTGRYMFTGQDLIDLTRNTSHIGLTQQHFILTAAAISDNETLLAGRGTK